MKKILISLFSFAFCSLFFAVPVRSFATEDVYFDLGDGSKLYIAALVCKVPNCISEGESTDWYNYSNTSENVAGDSGQGQTLVVSPGDSLSFLGATEVQGEASITPVYGIEFTNSSYITIDNLFGNVVEGVDFADIDNDNNVFEYYDVNNIILSSVLDDAADSQIGAITATVNSDAPDGTLITGIFYVIDSDYERLAFGPQKAMAAEGDIYARSEVRMLVSDPAETPAETTAPATTLPATGAKSGAQTNYLYLLISAVLISGTFYFLKRVKS